MQNKSLSRKRRRLRLPMSWTASKDSEPDRIDIYAQVVEVFGIEAIINT